MKFLSFGKLESFASHYQAVKAQEVHLKRAVPRMEVYLLSKLPATPVHSWKLDGIEYAVMAGFDRGKGSITIYQKHQVTDQWRQI